MKATAEALLRRLREEQPSTFEQVASILTAVDVAERPDHRSVLVALGDVGWRCSLADGEFDLPQASNLRTSALIAFERSRCELYKPGGRWHSGHEPNIAELARPAEPVKLPS